MWIPGCHIIQIQQTQKFFIWIWVKYNSMDFSRAVSDWHGHKQCPLSFLSRGLWPRLLITEQIESSCEDQWRNMIVLQRSPVLDCFESKAKMNNVVGVQENKYIVKIQANQALFPSLRERNMIFQDVNLGSSWN